MDVVERSLGKKIRFLLPSLKLKAVGKEQNVTYEQYVHSFLMDFGGYTAASGNQFGYWREQGSPDSYGEHKEFTVALRDEQQIHQLNAFLARLARDLEEESIYFEVSGEALLIFGKTA